MIAVDTNVIVRFLMRDDEKQWTRADRLMRGETAILVTDTVLLEAVWVLESIYGLSATDVAPALGRLVGLDNVVLDDAEVVEAAIEAYLDGLDFADMMHVLRSRNAGATTFATFDKTMIRSSRRRHPELEIAEP